MNKEKKIVLSKEDIEAGIAVNDDPTKLIELFDVSDKKVEEIARGYILGTQSLGKRRQIREVLEAKVTNKIGRKGKYLVDKLFELIEGVYVVQKDDSKGIRYYKVAPSLPAIVYALDRVLGKPKQYTEHTEEKRGLILVEHVIRNLAGNPYGKNGVAKNISGESRDGGDDPAGAEGGGGGLIKERVNEGVGAVAL